jgi:hypothetical protein
MGKEHGLCTRTSQKLSQEVSKLVPTITVAMIFDRPILLPAAWTKPLDMARGFVSS